MILERIAGRRSKLWVIRSQGVEKIMELWFQTLVNQSICLEVRLEVQSLWWWFWTTTDSYVVCQDMMARLGWMICGSMILKVANGLAFRNPQIKTMQKMRVQDRWQREIEFLQGGLDMSASYTTANFLYLEALMAADGWQICMFLISRRNGGARSMQRASYLHRDPVLHGPRMTLTCIFKVSTVWE